MESSALAALFALRNVRCQCVTALSTFSGKKWSLISMDVPPSAHLVKIRFYNYLGLLTVLIL